MNQTERLDRYMGYAGLIADNFIELDVTTADGNQITVSQTAHPDLFWAMRGAGHNFGIVTKFKYHIFDYPKGPDTYYATYFFTGDKLEAFFILLNKLLDNGKIPKDANTNAGLLSNPALSPKVSRGYPLLPDFRSGIDCFIAHLAVPILLLWY